MRVTVLTALVCGLVIGCSKEEESFDYQVHTVRRGDLRISIRQKGTIEAREPVKILNPIEGNSVILDLIPEGSFVNVGDRIIELDVSDARDKLLQQQISTSKAEQDLITAQKQLEITRQQNESDTKKSELDVLFAKLDLRQYLEGELPKEQRTNDAEITLAREELERAKDTLNWSERLFEKGYISSDKRESDRLQVKRRELEVQVAEESLKLLNTYTSEKKKKELEAKEEEAVRELDRTKTKCEAAEAQKVADVKGRQGQYDIEVQKLSRLTRQVDNNIVKATASGIVVYAREGGGGRDSKPMEPGSKVFENQVLVTIPDMKRVHVDVDVHESVVQDVRTGMPVIVTTDTGESLQGAVETIATVPDSQSWYRNPDLKVYSTTVTIANNEGKLKPGMNCYAEIVVAELQNVLSVPVHTVHDNGEKTFCYVRSGGKAILREVKCGKHNGQMVTILEGLAESDEVYLAAPPDADPVPLRSTVPTPVKIEVAAQQEQPAGGAPANGGGEDRRGGRRGNRGDGGEGGEGGKRGMRPSPEMMEKFKNMTPEEKEAFRKKAMEGGGMGGGGRGEGPGSGDGGQKQQ